MIRGYLLPVETVDGTEQAVGIDLIHDALLLTTPNPNARLLIMDTTTAEHNELALIALECPTLTQEQEALFNSSVVPDMPDPDTLRAEELLSHSPDVITQPEQWELLRIIGRRLGYRFD